MPVPERALALKTLLKGCPNTVGITDFIEKTCDLLKRLNSDSLS